MNACVPQHIAQYKLDNPLLRILHEQGITIEDRPDGGGRIFTLVDKKSHGSGYWNFIREDASTPFNLRISLNAELRIDKRERGVVLVPVTGGAGVSPIDPLPNFRMFKALTDNDPSAPATAKEFAASEGRLVVTWTDLGIGGIRTLSDLFDEFAGNNKNVVALCWRNVFDPSPQPDLSTLPPDRFITEPAQPALLKEWHKQLEAYRHNLAL